MKIILSLILFLETIQLILSQSTDVVMVQLVVRHGVRSVLLNYPNEVTPLSYWDKYGGLGQLTPVGMSQLYNFGKIFKNRYPFLNSTYDKSRVKARSTDYDRTLQTCYSFLAALYKPNNNQIWNFDSGKNEYLPIPVFTENRKNDKLLNANAGCTRYEDLRKEMRSTPEYLKMQENNRPLLEKISQNSGLNLVGNQYHIWEVADNALVDEVHNITIPKWVQDNYKEIMDLNDYTFYIDFVTVEMGKLISGPLLNEIINNLKSKIGGSTMEFYLYGVHDNYIAGLQKLLNTSNEWVQPHFATAYIFELRKDSSNNYYVQVLHKNNKYPAPVELVPVQIYGCNMLCPIDMFYSLLGDKIVTDIDSLCGVMGENVVSDSAIKKYSKFLLIVMVASNFLSLKF